MARRDLPLVTMTVATVVAAILATASTVSVADGSPPAYTPVLPTDAQLLPRQPARWRGASAAAPAPVGRGNTS